MMRLSRIWKAYILFSALLVLVMVLIGSILGAHLRKRLELQMKEDVITLARVLAKALPDGEAPSVLDPFCKDYQEMTGIRITIVRMDGKVIGESDQSSARLESHADRPEIHDAVKSGVGVSVRRSKTLRLDMLYAAVFLKEKGKVIRLSMPMRKVKEAQNEVMVFLVIALFLAPVLTSVTTFFLARYMSMENEGNEGLSSIRQLRR